jgi:hypothetical protein
MDAIAGLRWLARSGLLSPDGLCLPRALVCGRYLTLAGLEPTLLVGFAGARGHAWVELGGRAFLESKSELRAYRPALKVPPGGRGLEEA